MIVSLPCREVFHKTAKISDVFETFCELRVETLNGDIFI